MKDMLSAVDRGSVESISEGLSPHDKAVEAEDGEEAGDEVDQPGGGLQAELDDVDVIPGGPLLRQGGCVGNPL